MGNKLKDNYMRSIYSAKRTAPAVVCIEYFLKSSERDLFELARQLRFIYPEEEMIMFPAKEVKIRSEALKQIRNFLSGLIEEEILIKELEAINARV